MQHLTISLQVSVCNQELTIYNDNQLIKKYSISTAKKGTGQQWGSGQTPCGLHMIRAKIGKGCAINTVFVGRRPTGEIFTEELKKKFPEQDWILTRILWLSGMEIGKNRLGNVDTMQRYIYIHGTSDEEHIGMPSSRGCIRMRNTDIIELFEYVPYATPILIS